MEAYQARRGMVACEPAEADEARAMKKLRVGGPIEQACQSEERTKAKSLEPWPFCKLNSWEKNLYAFLCASYGAANVTCQAYTLRWASSLTYTPDNGVFNPPGSQTALDFYECKGFRRSAGIVKLKTAAKLFPQHRFFLCTLPNGKKGGWHFQLISA